MSRPLASTEAGMAVPQIQQRVEAIRRFNRFYTQQVGALQEGLLESPFSLTEARVIYELAHRDRATVTDLSQALGLDAGYVSRLVRGFQTRGLVEKRRSEVDGRQRVLSLTERGRDTFGRLDESSRVEIEALLGGLSEGDQQRLVRAMDRIESLLGASSERRVSVVLRPHEPGDMGWVVHRHGVLYNREYGWDETFEGLVAEIVAAFVRDYDPSRERCWIAELDGEPVGSVFVTRHPDRDDVARLRLLLVEPAARGLGIGRRLVSECTRFARRAGYRTLTLWTNSVLDAARHLYEEEGYALVHEEAHHSFGHDLVGQTWELRTTDD
jgi:DNA-binding MarR family transcriptional regulator/GNAT superfamily N-acetyltransferase